MRHIWHYLVAELRLRFQRVIPPFTLIERKSVLLDGTRAEHVTFLSCDIVYRGGPVQIGTMEADYCKITIEGAASNTIAFLRAMSRSPGGRKCLYEMFPDLRDNMGDTPEQARGCATKVLT